MKAQAFEFSSLYPTTTEAEKTPLHSREKHKSSKKNKRKSVPTESDEQSVTTSKYDGKSETAGTDIISSQLKKTSKSKNNNKSDGFITEDFNVQVEKIKKSIDAKSHVEQPTYESSKLKHNKKKHKHENKANCESSEDTEKSKKKKSKKVKQLPTDCSDEIGAEKTHNNKISHTNIVSEKVSELKIRCKSEGALKKTKKKRKKVSECESIEQEFENLELGENASSLADLLDDVKLTRKHNKKIKLTESEEVENTSSLEDTTKQRKKKKKIVKKAQAENEKLKAATGETTMGSLKEVETENVKERVKWNKRKWNKDRRGIEQDQLSSSILVDNLPLSLLTTYKKVLSAHFNKYGPVKGVGVAEVYPTVEPRPVFTTTLQFQNPAAALQALEEDNTELCGGRVRVRQPQSLCDTTVVVRCYAGCSPHLLTSVFAACGRLRSIREILKGKSSMPTAFVEFDGPAGVERALQLGAEARVGGKKLFVSRYEERTSAAKRKRTSSSQASDTDS